MKVKNTLKKSGFGILVLLGLFSSVDTHAQLLRKLKNAAQNSAAKNASSQSSGSNSASNSGSGRAGAGVAPYAEDFSDPKGYSGTYSALKAVELSPGTQKILKMKFVERDGDKFVNSLTVFLNKEGKSKSYTIHDKETKSKGLTIFRTTDFYSIWLIAVEPGVYLAAYNESTHKYELLGDEKIVNVYATDPAKLEAYDLETAQAKFDQLMKAGKAKEDEKVKSRLMEYDAYKQNVAKVVFVDNYSVFNYRYKDEPKEDPKKFIKTRDMGASLFFGAYFKDKIGTTCGKDCQLNVVYEMNGKQTDRVVLRNTDAKWNRIIKAKNNVDEFCYNHGHILYSPSENIMDYAFIYLLYQQKADLKEGQTYKLNVKVYSNRDGNNEEMIAEGAISLVYKKANMDKLFMQFGKWYDE